MRSDLPVRAGVSGLPGADTVDADGGVHPGLIWIGLPILKGRADELKAVRERAGGLEDVTLLDFPVQGQQTMDYEEYRELLAETPGADLAYVAVGLHRPRKAINKLVGHLKVFR